ncbi:MAG: hypothetical protein HC800_16905 [Phormidesmis sp. RL_2_1]|nr:hypothetical protein [Phormidesmis sp. RL_2_1]
MPPGCPLRRFPYSPSQRLAQESDPFPGVLLRGAAVDDVVIERQWNGFNAGAFTYVLTQYLWTALTPVTVGRALGQSQETLLRWGGSNQQPTASGNLNVDVSQLDSGHLDLSTLAKTPPIYDTPLLSQTRGQGVIQTISADGGTSATLWLGGFPPRVLAYLGPASVLSCRGRQLKLRSRDGLTGKAKLVAEANVTPSQGDQLPLGPLKSGDPIFEAVRSLPKSIDLVVALDSRLERIERVDATSALSALAFVSSTSDTALPADCLLAKPIMGRPETITASLRPHLGIAQQPADAAAPTELPENAGYGLFSLTRSLIPGTLTFQEEAIKPAITRLTPKLRSLLALKMLRLSENRASSQVPLRVSLEIIGPERKQLINRQTLEIEQRLAPSEQGEFIPQISVGERVRYRLFNQGAQPLYYTLINVDSRERLSAFCPVTDLSAIAPGEIRSSEDMAVMAQSAIAPGSSVAIPNAELSWAIEAPPGPVETYVVGSIQPLTRTFNTLLTASVSSGSQRIDPLPEPLTLIEALLSDLSQDRSNSNTYNLNVTQWATLNFTYQTV